MATATKCEGASSMCPTVIKTEYGTYIIIGRKLDLQQHDEIKDRVADDEAAVEIDAALVEMAVRTPLE